MKKFIILFCFLTQTGYLSAQVEKNIKAPSITNGTLTISKEALKDKIKGGWAGQTIGVTFGGPTEFKFNGTFHFRLSANKMV